MSPEAGSWLTVKETALLPSGSLKPSGQSQPSHLVGAQLVKDSIFLILLQVLAESVTDGPWHSCALVLFIALIN